MPDDRIIINPPELSPPSGFSHAIATTGGRTVWLAGQTALDADGALVGGDIVTQYDRALHNVLDALDAAGARPEDLVSMTTYIVDLDDYRAHTRELGKIWHRQVGSYYPAMAAVGVARLWDAAALVEIQGIAVIPG